MHPRAAIVLFALASCTGADPAHAPEGTSLAVDPVLRAAVQGDLAVTLVHTGSGEVDAEKWWPLKAELVNRGARAHWVVRANDGSDMGWREPHVYYTAEAEEAPGVWRAVSERTDFFRCGNYASNWRQDVVELAPGASIPLDDFLDPSLGLDFARSGRVRIFAHYDYSGGKKASWDWDRRLAPPPPLPDELANGGPFSLVSAPVELRVRVDTSLEIGLVARRRQIRVGERARFGALFDVWVVNRSSAPLELGNEIMGSGFRLSTKNDDAHWSELSFDLEGPRHLAPGEKAQLRSASNDAIARDAPGPVQLRVIYEGQRSWRSPWVALDVVP
jgi:hypothetical protein